jgi:hypothetical protein
MVEGAVIAIFLAVGGCVLLVRLARPPGEARFAIPAVAGDSAVAGDPAADPALTSPALVNLVLTRCAPDAAAYRATILDLAARGFLTARAAAGVLWLELAEPPAAGPDLTGYEHRVLQDMRARLATSGPPGAPFQAVAEACTVDVRGTWEPFERELREAARSDHLSRPLLPSTGRNALRACAVTVVVALGAFLATRLGGSPGIGEPALISAIAVIVFWSGLGWAARRDRLTAAGAALADRCRRVWSARTSTDPAAAAAGWHDLTPAALRRRAFAVASGIPYAGANVPVPAAGRRVSRRAARQPDAKQRPAGAWSSFTGTWRLVPIGAGERMGMGAGWALLAGAAWLGLITFAVSIPGGTAPLQLALGTSAVVLAGLGIRKLARMSALPRKAAFDGQVIARWHEETDAETSSGDIACVAVDDGERAWTFSGAAVFDRVALGDLVRLSVNPRSRTLIDLSVTGRPRAWLTPDPGTPDLGAPGPAVPEPGAAPAVLLTDDEAAAALGPLRRSAGVPRPAGASIIHQGERGTLSVVAMTGGIAQFNLKIGRKHGTPLPGIGDEAWLLNRRRTVITRVGDQVAKLTLSGRAEPGPAGARSPGQDAPAPVPLEALAETVAGRLAARAPAHQG